MNPPRLIVAASLLIVVAVSGCSSDSDTSPKSSGPEPSASEPTNSSDGTASSEAAYRFEYKVESGLVEYESTSSVVTGEFDPSSGNFAGTADSDLNDPFEFRVVDDLLYMHIAEGDLDEAGYPDGVEWISFDIDDPTIVPFARVAQPKFVEIADDAQTKGRSVGSESVDGTQTTHYVLEVDLPVIARQMNEALGSDDIADADDQMLEFLEGNSDSGAVEVHLWIDGDDHVRKFEYEVGERPFAYFSISGVFSDYGDVAIDAPPDDQVITRDEAEKLVAENP